ncbi:MAG: amino acid permease [Gemmataceae bacterium]|nr:amino acid permease [Gemmataceae bacterium]
MPDPADDVRTLHKLGYAQELARGLGGFSNFALSLSIICVLAGGLTSFHVGYCSVGGAAIGVGWPAMCLLSLCVAATMGQVASAYPTAGGLYHWAAILGGRGWGWATAWFNLAGLVTVLAAINVGTYRFAAGAFRFPTDDPVQQFLVVALVTASQAGLNHLGIRVTRVLTDLSGWWILAFSAALTAALLLFAPALDPGRLVTFSNYSGLPADAPVWPRTESLLWLFALGLLLPAYTITGFDASAHAAEETVGAAVNVPRGIVRSVLVSSLSGWVMLAAVVLAMPDPDAAAEAGEGAFFLTLFGVMPRPVALALCGGAVVAQYLCGLATVTSASRMAFAFARDGGLPASRLVRRVSPRFRTPAVAIWLVSVAAVGFTAYSPVYATITAVCVIFLYVSYVLPTAIGFVAHGRWWTEFGPWQLGWSYKPLAAVSVLGCVGLIVIGVQPPNELALTVVAGLAGVLVVGWFGFARRTFPGPPHGVLTFQQRNAIRAAEAAVHEPPAGKDL